MKRPVLIALFCFSFIAPVTLTSCFPESAVKQKKIDRERREKEREAMKEYRIALNKHHKSQTRETRARMRQTRKNARKVTPLKY